MTFKSALLLPKKILLIILLHSTLGTIGDCFVHNAGIFSGYLREMFKVSIFQQFGPQSDAFINGVFSLQSTQLFVAITFAALLYDPLLKTFAPITLWIKMRHILIMFGCLINFCAVYYQLFQLTFLGQFLIQCSVFYHIPQIIATAEFADKEQKSTVIFLCNFLITIAPFGVYLLNSPVIFGTADKWYFIYVGVFFISAFYFLIARNMPESPRQLYILNKDPAGAKESLKYYRGDNANVTEILEEYDDEVLSQKQIKRHSLLQIIKHPYLRQIFCHVIVLRLLHVFTLDINLGPYLQIIIERYGGSPTLAPTVALAMQSTGIIASFWAVVLFAIFKRKQIIMFTSTLTLISYLMMIVAEMSVDPEKQSNTSLGFLIAATMIDKAASGAGRSMTAIIVISDVCPVHSKDAIINAVTFSFYCVLALSSSIYFNMLNTYGIFVYIAGFLIILAINIYLVIFLPETKEKSINQIFDGYQELD